MPINNIENIQKNYFERAEAAFLQNMNGADAYPKNEGRYQSQSENLIKFLKRYPLLYLSAGTRLVYTIESCYEYPYGGGMPLCEHNYFWRLKDGRRPILLTTFLYLISKEAIAEADKCAEKYGLVYELNPDDVPVFYDPDFPCQVVVWYKPGIDWRTQDGCQKQKT